MALPISAESGGQGNLAGGEDLTEVEEDEVERDWEDKEEEEDEEDDDATGFVVGSTILEAPGGSLSPSSKASCIMLTYITIPEQK